MNPVANQRGFVNMASLPRTETCENNKQFETMSQTPGRVESQENSLHLQSPNFASNGVPEIQKFLKNLILSSITYLDDFLEGMKISLLTHIAVQFILCA